MGGGKYPIEVQAKNAKGKGGKVNQRLSVDRKQPVSQKETVGKSA